METIKVFDTTLRDGEQSPGAAMTLEQKYELAVQLARLGVDVIEAGFPVSSPHQFDSCRIVAERVKDVTVAVLARAVEKDLDSAAEAVSAAAHPRIHTFIATSPLHMKHKLGKDPDTVVEMAVKAVTYARNKVAEVEFSPEDATRSELPFLCRVIEKAIDNALLQGAASVEIVHGRGTGRLMLAVHGFLKENPSVKGFSHPDETTGGTGITVARLE